MNHLETFNKEKLQKNIAFAIKMILDIFSARDSTEEGDSWRKLSVSLLKRVELEKLQPQSI